MTTTSTRSGGHRGVAFCLLALGFGLLTACDVTVNDFERWRNRPGSEEKFVGWMLDPESTPDVRVKAIEMLVEQYSWGGREFLPEVANLPQAQRDATLLGALPHIVQLYEGLAFSTGGASTVTLDPVYVRDAAITLMGLTETEEVLQAYLDQVLARWLHDERPEEGYDPCSTRVGRHPNSRILSMVGLERGLPVVVMKITTTDSLHPNEDLYCQNSYLKEITWFPEVQEQLANAYVQRWNAAFCDADGVCIDACVEDAEGQPDGCNRNVQETIVRGMLFIEASTILKDFMFHAFLSSPHRLYLSVEQTFLDYLRPLTDESDATRYAEFITRVDGRLRWIGAANVLRLLGAGGVDLVLGAFPDAAVWGVWTEEGQVEEHSYSDGLKHAVGSFCGLGVVRELGDEGRLAFEGHLENPHLVSRSVAITCLATLGNAETILLLTPLLASETLLLSWGDTHNTVAALVEDAISVIQSRIGVPAVEDED